MFEVVIKKVLLPLVLTVSALCFWLFLRPRFRNSELYHSINGPIIKVTFSLSSEGSSIKEIPKPSIVMRIENKGNSTIHIKDIKFLDNNKEMHSYKVDFGLKCQDFSVGPGEDKELTIHYNKFDNSYFPLNSYVLSADNREYYFTNDNQKELKSILLEDFKFKINCKGKLIDSRSKIG